MRRGVENLGERPSGALVGVRLGVGEREVGRKKQGRGHQKEQERGGLAWGGRLLRLLCWRRLGLLRLLHLLLLLLLGRLHGRGIRG